MSLALRIIPEPLRTLGFAAITDDPVWCAIGTPLANPSRILIIQNLTDLTIVFSFGGDLAAPVPPALVGIFYDHISLLPNASFILDITANKTMDRGAFIAQGTTIYARRDNPLIAPSSGRVEVSTFYGTSI